MQIDELIKAAVKNGLRKICITDHIEPEVFDSHPASRPGQLVDNKIIKHFDEIDRAINRIDSGNKMDNQKEIKIMTGVELGLSRKTLKESSSFIRAHSFDYVLASLHEVDGMEVNYNGFHRQINKDEAFRLYLEELYHCIKNFDEFDCLGHLDLIRRYVKRFKGDNDIIYTSKFYSIVDDILKLVISKGKGIEINTSGYRYGLLTPMPSFEVIKRYRELGGEIVTVGSDAHSEEHVGDKIQKALELLSEAGFKYIFTFEKRKAVPRKVK